MPTLKQYILITLVGFMTTISTNSFAVSGRQVYKTYCAFCHKTGLNGAPKMGDQSLWKKRIEQGKETVYSNALNGKGNMPPKGGISSLSEDELKEAVDYMVSRSGGWEEK